MATYNGQRYLADQLQSIRQQHVLPAELVIADDGSTDGTLEVVDEFQKDCGFDVVIIRNNHLGVGANFLSALEASRGSYVAFADQDDVWLPAKLERLAAVAHETNADVVAHGVRTVDNALRPIRSGYPNVRHLVVEDRLQGNIWFPIAGNAMMFDRTLLDGCDWTGRPPSQWSRAPMNHDDLVKILGTIRGRTIRIPDRLLLYRQHQANVAGAAKTLGQAVRSYSDPVQGIAHRIDVLAEWAPYFVPLVPTEQQAATRDYFEQAKTIMKARYERLHEATPQALLAIFGSVVHGDYSIRQADGLDWKWALQDLYVLLKRYVGT